MPANGNAGMMLWKFRRGKRFLRSHLLICCFLEFLPAPLWKGLGSVFEEDFWEDEESEVWVGYLVL